MADARFTILGMTGSGKTCYLLGLFYQLHAGIGGYTITSDDNKDRELTLRFEKMSDASLGRKRFPVGTDSLSKYEFDLQYGYQTIMSFEWLDYAGGALTSKTSGNVEEYKQIKESITTSDSVFICVDGSLLQGDDVNEKIERVKYKCSSIINFFMSQFDKNNTDVPPVAIIITKYDLCQNDTNEEELWHIIADAFSPLFVKLNDEDVERIVTIIPVSIGKNIEDDNGSGKLEPLNVHLPIFMGLWFAIRNIRSYIPNEVENIKSEYQNNIDECNREIAEEEDSWFFKDDKKITRLKRKIDNLVDEGNEKIANLEDLDKEMLNYQDMLGKDLEGMSLYSNGEWLHF